MSNSIFEVGVFFLQHFSLSQDSPRRTPLSSPPLPLSPSTRASFPTGKLRRNFPEQKAVFCADRFTMDAAEGAITRRGTALFHYENSL